MNDLVASPGGVLLFDRAIEISKPKLIIPDSIWMPTKCGAELAWNDLDRKVKAFYDKFFKLDSWKERIMMMAGSFANYSSKALQDSMFGKTAFTAATTIYFGLWTAALDDTFTGATTGEAAYTSYARLGLTNNTTIFAAGSGTTTYTKSFPSDAAKNFATSTGGTATITYLGILDGNAGTSADHGYAWCSVTSTTINSGDTPQLAQNAISSVLD